MDSFVAIKTVFKNTDDRTIEKLDDLYDDLPRLKILISDLVNTYLTAEKINGKKVFLKPNWVMHSRKTSDDLCMRTNTNFLIAALTIILEKNPLKIIIGDAPIQACNWDIMLNAEFYWRILMLSEQFGIPIEIKDFRRRTFNTSKNFVDNDRFPLSDYIIFDTGVDSYLEPISLDGINNFRVTSYNPDNMALHHTKGKHQYCITKEFFEADIVISMPKIKTHSKTGITGALKNLVGLNGDKDFLPHHRIGGTGFGGDCYPGKSYIRLWSELAKDQANRNQGKRSFWIWTKVCSILLRLNRSQKAYRLEAGWFGNDTAWRMVMDLNKITCFGKADGTLAKEPQRAFYSLCDGIIGGQGDGPLQPEPLPLGIICFTNHSGLTDICMATLMGFDFQRIPMLAKVNESINYNETNLLLNNRVIQLKDLNEYAISAVPSPGWLEHLRLKQ